MREWRLLHAGPSGPSQAGGQWIKGAFSRRKRRWPRRALRYRETGSEGHWGRLAVNSPAIASLGRLSGHYFRFRRHGRDYLDLSGPAMMNIGADKSCRTKTPAVLQPGPWGGGVREARQKGCSLVPNHLCLRASSKVIDLWGDTAKGQVRSDPTRR